MVMMTMVDDIEASQMSSRCNGDFYLGFAISQGFQ